jgi:hypothetical protein
MEKASGTVLLEKPCSGIGHGQQPGICVPALEDEGENSYIRALEDEGENRLKRTIQGPVRDDELSG